MEGKSKGMNKVWFMPFDFPVENMRHEAVGVKIWNKVFVRNPVDDSSPQCYTVYTAKPSTLFFCIENR